MGCGESGKSFPRAVLGRFWGNDSFLIGAQSHAPIFFLGCVCPFGSVAFNKIISEVQGCDYICNKPIGGCW